MSDPPELVLTFLESVGRRQEAEYYLRLFRQVPKQSFAVIAAHPDILKNAPGMVVQPLRFLARLGLFPVVATGLFELDAGQDAEEFETRLAKEGVRTARVDSATKSWTNRVGEVLSSECCAVLRLAEPDSAAAYESLAELLSTLGTRKLAILRPRGGLGPKEAGRISLSATHHLVTSENGISVVNLQSDQQALTSGDYLDDEEMRLLADIQRLHRRHPQLLTSVASPLNLLRELFTTRGAGTLIKTGSIVIVETTYTDLDYERLRVLLESTFGRPLDDAFARVSPLGVYLERDYRGVAIVQPGVRGAFLTKFAVTRHAQGEGIGRDLWEAMLRDHPVVYWRARIANAASEWYAGECDGMHRVGAWRVYWKGLEPHEIDPVIRDALSRPKDFAEETQ